MNHAFHPSIVNAQLCAHCKYDEVSHTNGATCEVCGNSGTVEIMFGDILMCMDCQEKETVAQAELKAGAEERVKAVNNNARATLDRAKTVDQSIQVIQDIFNAETISIAEIKLAIDSDDTIVEKHFTLAKSIAERHEHFQLILDAARDTIKEAESKQRAIQQYYNDLANKLRHEQREQIKLKDVNYKPIEKKIVKPKAPTTKKVDRKELIRLAGILNKEFPNVPANLIMPNLQTLVISKNMTLEAASNVLRGMFGGKL